MTETKAFLLILLALFASQVTEAAKQLNGPAKSRGDAIAHKRIAGTLPNSKLTPGVPDKTVTVKELCTPGYTAKVRDVPESVKKKVLIEYGVDPKDSGKYEIDHLISLENGGSNDIRNLWPEAYCRVGNNPLKSGCWGAREKDKVETHLHRELCAGRITLEQDQKILTTQWTEEYQKIQSER